VASSPVKSMTLRRVRGEQHRVRSWTGDCTGRDPSHLVKGGSPKASDGSSGQLAAFSSRNLIAAWLHFQVTDKSFVQTIALP